jgi:hypothetical protein
MLTSSFLVDHIEVGNTIWSREEYDSLAPERANERQRRKRKARMRGTGRTRRVQKWRVEGHEYDDRDEKGRWIPR